jgi:hypothetical protein
MIVGSFVCVVLSIAVMIACCSALYIKDWDLVLFFDNLVICEESESNLVRHKGCVLSLDSFLTRSFGNGTHGEVNGLVLVKEVI